MDYTTPKREKDHPLPSAGAVVLNYRDPDSTKACVRKLLESSCLAGICIVDNASGDDSLAKLAELEGDRVRVLALPENGGYARGNNAGAAFLREWLSPEILFIVNPDIQVGEESLLRILDAFQRHPEYCVLTGLMKDPDGETAVRPYLFLPDKWENMGLCFYTYNRLYRKKHPCKIDGSTDVQRVDAASGCFFGIRDAVFEKVGGFDENTFLYYEEFCLACRLKRFGENGLSGIIPSAPFVHDHSTSIRKSLSELKGYRIYMRSKRYFGRTYLGTKGFSYVLLVLATGLSTLEECGFLTAASILQALPGRKRTGN